MDQRVVSRTPTGIPGLDEILLGGFASNRLYLIDGSPGVGKTTLAMQFLLEGVRRGEACLYVTLSETREEMEAVARSHGWSLEGIEMVELSQVEEMFGAQSQNTLFQSAEVELTRLTGLLLSEFDRVKPKRMVLDSLSELRLMSPSPFRYRRQILSFKHHFATSDCTLLLLDDQSTGSEAPVHSIVHGMVTMQRVPLKFGINRRFLSIAKMRGSAFREGNHDYLIKAGASPCSRAWSQWTIRRITRKRSSPAATSSSTSSWAVDWTAAPGRSSWARPAAASPRSPACTHRMRPRAAARSSTSRSTRSRRSS
jgi:circadian clock protein KaiC